MEKAAKRRTGQHGKAVQRQTGCRGKSGEAQTGQHVSAARSRAETEDMKGI